MNEKRIMMGFKAPAEIKNSIDEIAIQEDRTISSTIVMLLKMGIKKYKEDIGTPSSKALKVIKYIESKKFSNFSEFLRIVIQDNKYDWIAADMGWHMAYQYICAMTDTTPDPQIVQNLQAQEIED